MTRRADARRSELIAVTRRPVLAWPVIAAEPGPPTPRDPNHRARRVVFRTVAKSWNDSLFRLSAEGAFWSTLSTAPLLLALLGLVGYVTHWFGPETVAAVQDQVLTVMHGMFSSEVVDSLLRQNVTAMLHRGQADLVSVGFFVSLWAGSSAISSFVDAITIAYGQYEVRNPVFERIFALSLYLVALVAGAVTLPILAIGPEVLTRLFPERLQHDASLIITVGYYPGVAIALVLLLTALYKVAPPHKHPWYRGIPGALVASAIFVVASLGLRIYVSYVYTHGLTYGALATPVTFLLFYYMMSLAIIVGAQFNNATLEYFPPRMSRREVGKWRQVELAKPAPDEPPAPPGEGEPAK